MSEAHKKKSRGGRAAPPRTGKPAPVTERVRDLAWAGQHAQAIEIATAALAVPGLGIGIRLDLFDLRAESFIAQGNLELASADAQTMLELADCAKTAASKAQARNRLALVQMRRGEFKAAVVSATAALKAARQSKRALLEAMSLLRLAEAQFRNRADLEAAVGYAERAAKQFHTLHRYADEGRALWAIAIARSSQGRAAESNRAAGAALALCRQAGDLYGSGNARNMLVFNEPDLAAQLRLLHQALIDFETAGYVERQGIITHNLGVAYKGLGLYRRARRLMLKSGAIYRRTGARGSLGASLGEFAETELAMGHRDSARAYNEEMAGVAKALDEPLLSASVPIIRGRLALLEGDAAAALRHFEHAEQLTRGGELVASEISALTGIGEACLALSRTRPALSATRRATELHRAHDLAALDGMSPTLLWWSYSRALHANKQTAAEREALTTAYQIMCKGITSLSDEGLRRNYLNKIEDHREIVRAWLKDARKRRLSAARRTAHLRGEANLREPFERLVDTGLRLNELRSSAELHEFLIDEATELSGAERVLLVLETPQGLQLAGSLVPRGEDASTLLRESTPDLLEVRRTRVASLAHSPESADEWDQRSRVIAPLIAQREVLGYLYADLDGAFGRLREADRDLLGMLASQAAVALANARWSQGLEDKVAQRTEELQASNALLEQRANELAIINSVQSGLAAQLDIQAIFDLVGDKVRDTFNAQSVGIVTLDPQTNLMHYRYIMEKGQRQFEDPIPVGHKGFGSYVMRTRQPLLINADLDARRAELGSFVVGGGEAPKSGIWVPLVIGDEPRGVLSIQNIDRENAFTDSDFKLLITLAGSLSVAFENARLFDETQRLFKVEQQRAAELAIINSVQEGLAAQLDFQAIVDLVGDKIREIFGTQDMSIAIHERQSNLMTMPYYLEHAARFPVAPFPQRGLTGHVMRTRKALVINKDFWQRSAEFGSLTIGDPNAGATGKSYVGVPLLAGEDAFGVIALYGLEENAFSESSVNLLTTLANSMSVALENARLFGETQRLLSETEQRAAELAVINSVQEGLASKLEMQAIYDLIGNKIREIFAADVVGIGLFDPKANRVRYPFLLDHGERFHPESGPPRGFNLHILQTRQPIVIHTADELSRRMAELDADNIGGETQDNSFIYVPILRGDTADGVITVGKQREHAFADSDVSLLTTLGNAMSIALENARLFDEAQRLLKETEQRAAELAVINRIQEGMAAELDFQAIIDLVGDKLREVFKTRDIGIRWHDAKTNLIHYVYQYEHGVRLETAPRPPSPGGPWSRMVATRQPVVANNLVEKAALGIQTVEGTDPSLSSFSVPILGSDRLLGSIAMEDYERENAYGEADVRLLSTVAASMGVALENARLFDETQRLLKETEQRAAELALINRIQEGMAAELDFQAIIDLVGDKLREVFKTGDIGIRWYDAKTDRIHYVYQYEHGVRLHPLPTPPIPGGPWTKMVKTRQAVVANSLAEKAALGIQTLEGTDPSISALSVPILGSDRVLGSIALEDYERENAYGESEVRLLSTVAASMGVALENARLFDETQHLLKETEQRAAELALINRIQEGMAAELDFQAIIDLVGDKLREVFRTGEIGIRWHDPKTNLIHYLYEYEHGVRLHPPSAPPKPGGVFSRIEETRAPLVINNRAEMTEAGLILMPGTDQGKSHLSVPIIGSDRMLGVIVMEDYEREHAYGEGEVRLLSTVAASMGVALENARLFDETQRLLKETEQRAAELAVINRIQEGMAAELDFQAIVDLVGDKLREVFKTDDMGIRWYDPKANLVHFLYLYEHGVRLTLPPIPPGAPFLKLVETRQPLVVKNRADYAAQGFVTIPGTDQSHSSVGVPILGSDRVLGSVSIEDYQRENAYGEAEVRLLSTVAASMGVALENARLFDETQRLFKESEQRAAELAIINSVQQALAAELNMQGIYDAVGDKIREIFHQADTGIRIYDPETRLIHYPYAYEGGRRISIESAQLQDTGFAAHVMRTRETLVVNENIEQESQKYGSFTLPGTQGEKSLIFVPLVAGDQARGIISLADLDREHAFGPSDVRLLQTLANAMSVALENARLFDETQRLFKESEQRAAELAIINSVQHALAAELNMQGIYDAVGDKISEIFDHADVGIRIYDPQTGLLHFPYTYESGRRIHLESEPLGDRGFTVHVMRTRQPLVINEDMQREVEKHGSTVMPGTQMEKSAVLVPLVAGDQARGSISLIDMDREHAFSASDVRLLQTLANSMSVALENARLFDETQRRTRETAALAEVGRDISSTLDLSTVMNRIARHARDLLNAGSSAIFLPDAGGKSYRAIVAIGDISEAIQSTVIELGQGIIGSLVQSGRAECINDTQADPRAIQIPGTGREEHERLMVAPLLAGKTVKGVMAVWRTAGEPYGPSELEFLVGLSLQATVAIENARLFAESQQRAAELATVNTVSRELAGKLDLSNLLELVGEQIRNVFRADVAYVALYDRQAGMIEFPYQYGDKLVPLKYGEGLTSRIIK